MWGLIRRTRFVAAEKFVPTLVGRPHQVSNIRPVRLEIPHPESSAHREWRLYRQTTQDWHDAFWRENNERFMSEKLDFIKAHGGKDAVTDDELGDFFRDFALRNAAQQQEYNQEWWGRNAKIFFLGLKSAVSR